MRCMLAVLIVTTMLTGHGSAKDKLSLRDR
jgi:hypothetical protein